MRKRELILPVAAILATALVILMLYVTKDEREKVQRVKSVTADVQLLASQTKTISCGQDIDNAINNDPKTVATRFNLGACPYTASATVQPGPGDELIGPAGTFIQRGPAYDPEPMAQVQGGAGVKQVVKWRGGTAHMEWVEITGGDFDGSAGSGVGYAGGSSSPDSLLWAVEIHNNEGAGISNFNGTMERSELYANTTNAQALGFIGSGLKAITEVHLRQNYVHDTRGNGIWCDVFCRDANLPGDADYFLAQDNLVTGNGRAGIRWERIGDGGGGVSDSGEAIIEGNVIQRNGFDKVRGGVDIRDAQDAIVRSNTFGGNVERLGVRATDSGRSDRPNLENIKITNNFLNGDIIKGCGGVVACSSNTP